MNKLDKLYELLLEFSAIIIKEEPDSYWAVKINNLVKYLYEKKDILDIDTDKVLSTINEELLNMYYPKEGGLGDFYVYRDNFEEMDMENRKLSKIQDEIFNILDN